MDYYWDSFDCQVQCEELYIEDEMKETSKNRQINVAKKPSVSFTRAKSGLLHRNKPN